jgi:hypothetical protein
MRRVLRWLRRIALGGLLFAVLAIAATLIAVHTDWGRERVRRAVVDKLTQLLPGGTRIGRIEGSVFGELVARDVEIAAADGRSTFAKVGALRIELALGPLLSRTAELEHVVAEDLELYPTRRLAVVDNGEPPSWSVELRAIEVHRGRVVIEGAQPVTLEGLELAGQASLPLGGPISAVVAELRGTWRERGAPFEGSAAARIGEQVAVPRLELRVGGAGGAFVRGSDIVVAQGRPTGALHVDAPAAVVARLLPQVVLPADAHVDVKVARAGGGELSVELAGALGASRVTGKLLADPAAPRVRGVISARDVAIAELTAGAHDGGGAAIVAFVADPARVRGTAIATGRLDRLPAGDAVVSFDAALDRAGGASGLDALAEAAGLVLATAEGGTSARAFARLGRKDGALAIEAARVAVSTRDAARLAGDAAPVRGSLAVAAELGGTIAPLDARAAGTLDAERLEYGERRRDALSARRLHVGFRAAAKGSLAGVVGEAAGWIRGVADGGVPRGDADFRAQLRADRTIAAWVHALPAAAPIVVDAGATIAPGAGDRPTVIALGEHAITMPGGERWIGRGGRVVLGPARVVLERLRTGSRGGRLEVGATLDRVTKRLTVALDADAVAAASIDPAYRGVASGQIRLERRGLRWDGTIALAGRGLSFAPDAAPLDADLHVKVAGRHVVLESAARTAALGGVRFELDVDGPADLTDADGWRLLPRGAVRSAKIGVDGVSLAAAAVPTGGVVDGTLYIAGADTTGTMKVRAVRTPLGEIDGDITFRPEENSELGASSTVHVHGLGDADVSARIAFPPHPFDPAAWQRLGRGALAHLGASFSDIAIDPERLARLGIDAPYRGVADVDVVIADGATSATVDVAVKNVSGGPIVQPIELRVTATADGGGTRVRGHVEDTREPARTVLAAFEAAVPSYSLERWIAAPAQAPRAPITGAITVGGAPITAGPDDARPAAALPAPTLLAVFGRRDLAKGTIAGSVGIGGTLGAPTAAAQLALSGLEPARRVPGRPAPRPLDLGIEARWTGASAFVRATGRGAGGALVATVEGSPAEPARLVGSLAATDFDLAPLAAFLPGQLAAVEGKLDGSLTARGLDGLDKLRGQLTLTRAVVPLHPMLGTLRNGSARARIDDHGLSLELGGSLGRGAISLTARSAGHDLERIEATGKLRNVSPLGQWEPLIVADIDAKLQRSTAEQWAGTIKVTNASAVLPPAAAELGDPEKPRDLLFVEDGPIVPPRLALTGRPPDRPWLVADVELAPMKVKAEDLFDTRGEISGKLQVAVGDTVGLIGSVDIENGIVGDLFGRRYTATGGVSFDGTVEPKVDVTLQHEFPALVLTAHLTGAPATIALDFRSDPPTYTRDQLAGFFFGGEPGGDPSMQTREAATGAGAAVLSSALGGRIRKRLPVKIEQLGCDPGNSVTGASCTVGRWFGEKLFVAFKRRIDVQQSEKVNANEVQGQYYLRRNIYLEMAGGDAGSGGLDLLWRRRW